ncbi:hypothetical protein Kpho02_60240 [Kitasatospora phosalacinea]|uniref:SsgA n=1 Tax=Kitasatospora phosalacinea TaxID=2065 RepID=A0A9W6V3J5_9ACTN|nr:SsgA family sporulation/cell division regulator [Kitasatospora phosalacinea]GLW73726.1 hypothetical protein Kpho02_60240 [Kitasatospora phosalacinea]
MRVRFPESPSPDLEVDALLRYASQDPFAVCLTFPFDDGFVERYFCRGLLEIGRHQEAGLGDVTIAPGKSGTVIVRLHGAHGSTSVVVPTDDLGAFLADAYALVPVGAEHLHLDLDTVLVRLLAPPRRKDA